MIYIVKIFNSDMNKEYLTSNLFAWGLPLTTTLWRILYDNWLESALKRSFDYSILEIVFNGRYLSLIVVIGNV